MSTSIMEDLNEVFSPTPQTDFDHGYSQEQRQAATGWTTCQREDGGGFVQFLAVPGLPDIDTVLAEAEAKLRIDVPEVETSPPRRGTQLVSVPVWFWVNNAQPVQETASIDGLAATITAKPLRLHVDIRGGIGDAAEDNVSFDCDGLGTRYDKRRHRATDASQCSHAFDWNDTFTVEATVDWALSWTATNGQEGTLPDQHRTTSFTLTVQQAQAVTD